MSEPALTVLMAVKDAMPLLPLAVESILGQTFKDFELLIIDDHSGDQTAAYLAAVTDARIRVLQSPHQGQTLALNHGLAQARGSWIARMDGDDWSFPERLAKQWARAQSHPKALFVSADYLLCDEDLTPVAPIALNTEDPGFLKYARHKQNPFCHPVMMFQTAAVRELGGYPAQRRTAQDYALWLSLLDKGPFAHVPEALLKYRLRPGAVSIARYSEQKASRNQILRKSDATPKPLLNPSPSSAGLYAYRLGFAAWLAGNRTECRRQMMTSLTHGTRVLQSMGAILLSLFPRRVYLRITGYDHVYR